MKNIVLTGFMASGKTQIGKALAELIGFDFVDTDEIVVADAGCTINEIFAVHGEEKFRELESLAIEKAAEMENVVIATGGGAVLRKKNLTALRKTGVIVNLEIAEAVLLQRMKEASGTRPLMRSSTEDVLARLRMRAEYYADCDERIAVSNDKTPEEHAEEILKILDFQNEIS